MFRRVLPVVLMASFVATIAAQTPAGWKVHIDRSTNAQDPDNKSGVMFMSMGKGFHVSGGPAGTYWHPSNTAMGNYTLKGTFTQLKPSSHTNYFGLVFGGQNLDNGMQNYLYFTVAQDGTWLIKRREGDVNTQDVGRGTNAAVKKLDATGKSVNALEVRVMADKIDYVVNGTVVHSTPKTGLTARTDGIYGVRSNHALEIMAEGLSVTKG